mmetsp:Transcript_19026/g.48831  ORF Transcript_19026/g.48831 Transcript_19026/m.48831 type:complete len:223 (-) Transcript_19026:694-1362(-)
MTVWYCAMSRLFPDRQASTRGRSFLDSRMYFCLIWLRVRVGKSCEMRVRSSPNCVSALKNSSVSSLFHRTGLCQLEYECELSSGWSSTTRRYPLTSVRRACTTRVFWLTTMRPSTTCTCGARSIADGSGSALDWLSRCLLASCSATLADAWRVVSRRRSMTRLLVIMSRSVRSSGATSSSRRRGRLRVPCRCILVFSAGTVTTDSSPVSGSTTVLVTVLRRV